MFPFINDEGDEDGRSYLYVIRRDGRRMRRLHRSFLMPTAWSPAGRRIVFVHRRGLASIRPDGTRFRIIRPGQTASRLRFAPSGNRLAISSYTDTGPTVSVLNLRTGSLRELPGLNVCCASDTIAWTPDGHRLAFLEGDWVVENGITHVVSTGLYTVRPDGADRRRHATLPASAGLGGLAWRGPIPRR